MTQQPAPLVPVTVHLKGATFRHYEDAAKKRRTTADVLISLVADRAVPVDAKPPRRYVRVTSESAARIRELYRLGYGPRAIAREIGCSPAAVYNHLPTDDDA